MAANPNQPYRRLPGTGYRRMVPGWAMILLFFVIGIFVFILRGKRVQLWLGDDHLLLVEWDGTRENYKRFRYQDIQAVIIRKTIEATTVNSILGGLVIMFTAFAIIVGGGGAIFLGILAGAFALFLAGNFLAGPMCVTHIRTAVQTDEMPSLCRLRNARKALAELRPLIAAAQGELPAGDIPARIQELLTPRSQFIVDDPNAPPRIIS